jgi:COP9 signalosome complex subunit 12
MDKLFCDFREAYQNCNGYQLSETLIPLPSSQPDGRRQFFLSSNAGGIRGDIRYNILYDCTKSVNLPLEQYNAWVEVYVAYWKSIGEILKVQEAGSQIAQVRAFTFLCF